MSTSMYLNFVIFKKVLNAFPSVRPCAILLEFPDSASVVLTNAIIIEKSLQDVFGAFWGQSLTYGLFLYKLYNMLLPNPNHYGVIWIILYFLRSLRILEDNNSFCISIQVEASLIIKHDISKVKSFIWWVLQKSSLTSFFFLVLC